MSGALPHTSTDEPSSASAEPSAIVNEHRTGFSVAIVCAHSADSLSRTLKALAVSDYQGPVETMVIDDGAQPERARAVWTAASEGLHVHYAEMPGTNRADALNFAVREASGEYLAFLDDDCVPPRGWLSAFETSFDEWVVGVTGGPDRAPKDASIFERCVDYVLTSFAGTLGFRRGPGCIGRYYPRPWNMAARREAVLFAGGFDEDFPEAPEVPMIRRMEKIGYRASYQPDACLWHRRETDLRRFLRRDFRLSMERSRGTPQPGVGKAYSLAVFGLAAVLLLAVSPITQPFGVPILGLLAAVYAVMLLASGLHALTRMGSPVLALCVPPLLLGHHAAHLAGYIAGRVMRVRRPR